MWLILLSMTRKVQNSDSSLPMFRRECIVLENVQDLGLFCQIIGTMKFLQLYFSIGVIGPIW